MSLSGAVGLEVGGRPRDGRAQVAPSRGRRNDGLSGSWRLVDQGGALCGPGTLESRAWLVEVGGGPVWSRGDMRGTRRLGRGGPVGVPLARGGEEWPVWLGGQELAEGLGPAKVQVRIALT